MQQSISFGHCKCLMGAGISEVTMKEVRHHAFHDLTAPIRGCDFRPRFVSVTILKKKILCIGGFPTIDDWDALGLTFVKLYIIRLLFFPKKNDSFVTVDRHICRSLNLQLLFSSSAFFPNAALNFHCGKTSNLITGSCARKLFLETPSSMAALSRRSYLFFLFPGRVCSHA